EGDDLGAAALLQNLGGHGGAGNGRLAERDRVAADHQNLAELDDLAGIALDLLDLDHILGGNAVLLAAGTDDCEHRSCPRVRFRRSDRSGPASFSRGLGVDAARAGFLRWGVGFLRPRRAATKGAELGSPAPRASLWRPGPELSRKQGY